MILATSVGHIVFVVVVLCLALWIRLMLIKRRG